MTTIAGVDRKCTTKNRNDKQHIPNWGVQLWTQEGKTLGSCEETQEEHIREHGNYIATGKRRIWQTAPLQV